MADTKTTALTENTAPILTDIMPMVDDPGSTPATQKVTLTNLQGLMAAGMYPGGRLTLTTATPVTTADVTGATTVYYTPYIHDNIRLYDGTTWRTVAFTEKSITMVGATASKPYDVWGYLSGGTLALEKLVWTDGSNRATALAYQNGRLVKSGDATRLYLGTVYCNSSGGQTNDNLMNRFVWNYYNRVDRRMYDSDETGHSYNSSTARSWNNDATIRVEFVIGVAEDYATLYCNGYANAEADGRIPQTGVGLDVTNNTTINYSFSNAVQGALIGINQPIAPPTAGYHFVQAVERAPAGQCTFSGVYYGAMIRA